MTESLILTPNLNRGQRYLELLPQIKALVDPETDLIANMGNVAAILMQAFEFHWIGFYRAVDSELVLGPFQGPLACTRIQLDRGVCGTTAAKKETVIVPDVDKFPGHIACSSLSKSEIVVPKVVNHKTEFVLDIDSALHNDFDDVDAKFLNEIVYML